MRLPNPKILPKPTCQFGFSRSRQWCHTYSSIVRPHIIPTDWRTKAVNWTIPSEEEILKRAGWAPGRDIPDECLTGVNTSALAYAASHAMSISEIPTIEYENQGGFNTLLRIEFPTNGRKLLARIPLKHSRTVSRIECSVATMSFARHVRNIPTPGIFAWSATTDNPVGAPYVLQEYAGDVVEPWQVWGKISDCTRSRILDELARWHAVYLEPLPYPLHGVGDLGFAPGLSTDAALSDPQSYIVRPLQPREPIVVSSVSLDELWDQLWSHQVKLCVPGPSSCVDREALRLLDDEQCDSTSFMTTAQQTRSFAKDALRLLEQYPQYALPCLVNYDYAYRNILLDPQTYRVKAFIDWDDVHVMPFIVGVNVPEDLRIFGVTGLSPESDYYQQGWFRSFPPDEYGEIIGAVDKNGKRTDVDEDGNSTGVHERDERILNTAYREEFVKALKTCDRRFSHPDMWRVRSKALKAHDLLKHGGWMWWDKREWLDKQMGG